MTSKTPLHKHKLLQAVRYNLAGTFIYGLIISNSIWKLDRKNQKDEPYYLITGYGPAIWENHLEPISDEEYQLETTKLLVK